MSRQLTAAVVNAIVAVTGGNFRLVNRLLAEIERAMAVNRLSTVTIEVVAFARESLVIGPTRQSVTRPPPIDRRLFVMLTPRRLQAAQ
jgi:hypothetical protein